jgi:hypothetical protein
VSCVNSEPRHRFVRRRTTVRLYALVEVGDPQAIDVYLCEENAQRALEGCLRDEPDWQGLLRVIPIEFDAVRTRLC